MTLKAKTCCIDGCGKKHFGHGWCSAHYNRWRRHGNPLAGGTSPGEPERFLREVVMPYEGTDCLIWPYARNGRGYAHLLVDGQNQLVQRIVCRERRGQPPTPEHQAAHSCGRGRSGCVAGKHLDWKTHAENDADKDIHGGRTYGELNSQAKLTEPVVREIISLRGIETQRVIADRLGISIYTVRNIHQGVNWGWIGAAK